jgi:VanZ family protein
MHNLTQRFVQMLRFLVYWVPPVLWMVVIFWFSTDRFSSGETGSRFELWVEWVAPWVEPPARVRLHILVRKLGHLIEYGVLAVLWMRAFESRRWKGGLARQLARAGLVSLLVFGCAIADEWRQSFTASRTGSPIDCLIDLGGGIIGLCLRQLTVDWMVSRGHRLTLSRLSDTLKKVGAAARSGGSTRTGERTGERE